MITAGGANSNGTAAPTAEQVAAWLALFIGPDQVTELRALDVSTPSYRRPHTVAGYFDGEHLLDMAQAALQLGSQSSGVYFVLNGIDPDILARRKNRVDNCGNKFALTTDLDIIARRWLLVDCDPKRKAGISANDAEKAAAKEMASTIHGVLTTEGWPSPIVADSGNGHHLSYPLAGVAPTDAEPVRLALHGLGDRFDTEAVTVDRAVFNAARIVKLYGTPARKGDPTDDRPQRLSAVLEIPEWISALPNARPGVTLEQLQRVASWGGAKRPATAAVSTTATSPSSLILRAESEAETILRRAARYLEKIDPGIQGQNGSRPAYRAAQILVNGFNLSPADAKPLMQSYSARCSPPWTDKEIDHKLNDALTKGDKKGRPRGYLLAEDNGTGQADGQGAAPQPWPDLMPLKPYGELPSFPVDVLPSWLSLWVSAGAEATQTPTDLAGILSLAVCAAALAGRFRVEIRPGWTEPLNVFGVVALPPGERKSAVFSAATEPLRRLEEQERDRLRPELAKAAAERETLQLRLRKAKDAAAKPAKKNGTAGAKPADAQSAFTATATSGNTATIDDVRHLAEELEKTPERFPPQYFCEDSTVEHLGHLLARHGRMLQMGAEGTAFELALGRYSEGKANFDVYLKGHAGDFLRVGRTGRDCSCDSVDNPALSLALAVQPDVISGLAREASARKRGFVARFLYSLPRSRLGSRQVGAPPVPHEVATAFENGMVELWRPWTPDDGTRYLKFSPAADEAMREFERWIEPRLAEGEELSATAGWSAKLAGAAGRIAGVLHGIEAAGGQQQPDATSISTETAAAAIRFSKEYLLPHALAVLDLMGADERLDTAHHLWRCIRRELLEACQTAFSRREALRWGGRRFKGVAAVDAPLSLLTEYGYVRQAPNPGANTRHDRQIFEANPAALAEKPNPEGADSADSADS
jgi:hypothetical protein